MNDSPSKDAINAIRNFFVTAKHWQLFLIVFAPMGVTALLVVHAVSSGREISVGGWPVEAAVEIVMSAYAILWIWSYGSFLTSIAPDALRLKLRFFRIAIVFPFIWTPVSNMVPVSIRDRFLPVDILFLFCALYAAYLIAKSLVIAETGKPATFSDSVVAFFLLWLWPIGIWFFQPRINRLFLAKCADGGGNISGGRHVQS